MEPDKSLLLQKQVKDNSEDLRNECLDIKNWEEQMKRKEQELLNENVEQHVLPPIRSRNKKKSVVKESKNTENSKRIKGSDYASWDKFDVNKACKELEEEQSDECSEEEPMSEEQLEENHRQAIQHKQQGNVFVQRKQWDKAIASYSEAIKIFPYDAAFYANRALCYLKQDNLYSAEADSSSAIQLDETYAKAYHRRATARVGLKQYKEAKQDVEKLLMLEPANKEANILFKQIIEWIESLRSDTPEIDETKDIPIEKKIGEKMLASTSSNNGLIDTNKIKENSLKLPLQSEVEIDIIESKKDLRIPAWLPEKDNVEIVEPVEKPAHLRSKEPLKKIPIQEADLSKPIRKYMETPYSIKLHAELLKKSINDVEKSNENIEKFNTKPKLEQDFLENSIEIPSIPKTAVQFLIDWKKCSSSNFRYRYLKQLQAGDLPKIFQDSMESDIFSNILATLKTEFINRHELIFSYLKDLSNIKRFRTFIMFISNLEKQDLDLMFAYCRTAERISEEEITDLQNKYEI